MVTISGINITQIGTENINIEEITPPEGYQKTIGTITIEVTKDIVDGECKIVHVNGTNASVINNIVTVIVPNQKLEGNYQLQIVKVDKDNTNTKLAGATFKITLANGNIQTVTTNQEGIANISGIEITQTGVDTIKIEETSAPQGYQKINGTLNVQVTKTIVNGSYQATSVSGVNATVANNIVTVTVPNQKLEGNYQLQIVKVDKDNTNTKLAGATFKITLANGNIQTVTTNQEGIANISGIEITQTGVDTIKIEETSAPQGYQKINGTLNLEVTKAIVDEGYQITNVEINNQESTTQSIVSLQNGIIQLQITNELIPKEPTLVDFKLVKKVSAINNQEVSERIEKVDVSKLNTIDEKGELITNAEYKINKEALLVKKQDIITYTFRIYNEGMVDGYAQEITEEIPEGLEFIWSDKVGDELRQDPNLTKEEKEAIEFNQKYLWGKFVYDENRQKIIRISSDYLSKEKETTIGENLIKAFGENDGNKTQQDLHYKEIAVKFRVIANENEESILRNEAAITKNGDPNGEPVEDRDSKPEEWVKYEDDEDYDNVIVEPEEPIKPEDKDRIFDLALRKFIVAISKDTDLKESDYLKNEDGTFKREPVVDTSKLNQQGEDGKIMTTSQYNHTKEPLVVKQGDIVVYMLRVYNEGNVDGYAGEIKDYLPPYLEFVKGEFNEQYGWELSQNEREVTTKYLENEKIEKIVNNETLSYKEVPIMCKIKTTAKANENITNIAMITKYLDTNKEPAVDRDSKEEETQIPKDEDLPNYKEDEQTKDYVPGQQDNDDFEKIVIQGFDLSLKKFITQIDDKMIETRIPQVKYDIKKGELTYQHTKEPVDVVAGNTITYTIRVYNEGRINGYASQILDNIPDGLEFLPENETNTNYGWKMYRKQKQGEEIQQPEENIIIQDGITYVKTSKVEEAQVIVTNYLSKEHGELIMEEDKELTQNPNLLKAFIPNQELSDTNPDHKEVKVAFKVKNQEDRKIISNIAQISKNTDEEGKDIEDEDSTPGKWEEDDDDQDKEDIKLNYFDLKLKKWVTQAIVIEDQKQTVTQTGYDPLDEKEPIVKIELHRKKLDQVMVKFKYSIRVYNEGDIEGYAKEITDYIPEGLKFEANDNPSWTQGENNRVSTKALENTLLQPGQYADVEIILTWINHENNMGLMNNIAEITKDDNKYGVPDKDSTPNNQKPQEDDTDDAKVMVSISTGQIRIYFALAFIISIIIVEGIAFIKKFVI